MSEENKNTDLNNSSNEEPREEEKTVSKKQYDKLASELAELKRQNKAKMSEEEQKEAEFRELQEKYQTTQKELQKNKVVNGLVSEFGEDNAEKIAEAVVNGEVDKVTKLLSNFAKTTREAHEKALEEVKLQSTQTPNEQGDTGSKPLTKEDYAKMNLDERNTLFKENPAVFKQISGL